MPTNRESSLRQPPFPPLARADCRRLVEQAVFFLPPGEPGELGHQRVPGWEEHFLAVEDGGLVLFARIARSSPPANADDLTHCAVGSMSSLSMAGKTAQASW